MYSGGSPLTRRTISLLLLLIAQRIESASLGGDITVNTNLTQDGSPYVITQDLVVADNATLTIQPGVELHFNAGVAFQVKGLLQAKGDSQRKIIFKKIPTNKTVNVDDLNVTSPYNDGIRLRGGKNYRIGRLEIYVRGSWGTVCHDSFDIKDAQVACRQLGFLGAKRFYTHGRGTGPTWLDEVNCRGTEKSLLECKHQGIGVENCNHREDIGVECHSLAKLLASKVFWKGIQFSTSSKPPSLYYVHISEAYEAVKGSEFLPDLHHVTVKSSVYGVRSDKMNSPLTISDSSIRDNKFAGIQINSRSRETKILNTAVENTTNGDGLSYFGIVADPVDFCSVDENNVVFPIIFQALGKARTRVDCAKIIQTQPGQHLTVHYQSMTGEKFDLEVYDGDTVNTTKLTHVNQWTGVNQAVTPVSTSGHAIYIRFRYSGSNGASVKFMLTDERAWSCRESEDCGVAKQGSHVGGLSSFMVSNCTFNDNNGKGVTLKDITAEISISTTSVFRNRADGIAAERILGTITTSDTHFINNTANGLLILDSSFISCNLHHVSNKGNSRNGFYLQRVALRSNVSDSIFNGNALHGFALTNGAGEIDFRNITAVLNTYSGVRFYNGKTSSSFLACNLSQNNEDGCCISNQGGSHHFFNCTANSNSRHGISLYDVRRRHSREPPRYQFKDFTLVDSVVNDNTQYGIKLGPECQYWSESAANVTMTIDKNHIWRNSKGGIYLAPDSCSWSSSSLKPRKVDAIVRENHFEENKLNAFYAYCTGFLGFDAVLESNKFINNTDRVLTLIDDDKCGANYRSKPVKFDIRKNIFTKNRAGNILFIDYSSFPDTRSATVRNNSFENNEGNTRDLFPNFFRRTTSRAVIVLKEGSFTLRENTIENPSFAFQFSTLRHDHRRVIDAMYNWWGSQKECEIIDKIFDFRHRVQLSPVEFFPFFLSVNKSRAINSNTPRPSCFLRQSAIGGIVDRPLALSVADSPYEVRDDVIVLANGSLVIPKNVTLLFPPRSAMVVQGTLRADGDKNERVRFIRKKHEGEFRLSGGSGPWEGRLEFLVNETWMPMCLPYYRSFTVEAKIICQQLNLYYHRYEGRSPPSGQETIFVHNVICDGNVDSDIMNCSANTWSYGPSCRRAYTVNVYCQQYNWAGLHLAMSDRQSLLRHLDIEDAGFAYRSDRKLPGTAFRIDLNHHNMSNIFINNSVGIGVQVVHQSLFHQQSLMPSSSISNTKSHGIHTLSPLLTFTDVNVTENSGNGFVYASTWDSTNTFAVDMASPGVYQTFLVCSKNKTFLPPNRVFHFKLEALEYNMQRACQHVLETEPAYKLVIQELYYQASYNHFTNVYDGVNISVGSPWKMQTSTWMNRPVFNSTKSSVLFDFNKRARWTFAINFLVYTAKESKHVDYTGGEITITRSKISNNVKGGIFIGGHSLRSFSISNTEISNSREFGIKLQPRSIKFVKISSTNLEQNKQGIVINPMSSSEFKIENCAINGSLRQGMYIFSDSKSVIRIVNSIITSSGDRGLTIEGRHRNMFVNLLVSGSTFAWNKIGAVSCSNTYDSNYVNIQFESSNFFRNVGPTIEIFYSTKRISWAFLNNTFEDNRGFFVIGLGTSSSFTGSNYRPNVVVSGNRFLSNQCPDKGVIDIRRDASSFVIKDNTFEFNKGSCVLLEGTSAYSPILITDNTFSDNFCEDKSVIEALRLDQNAKIANNTFAKNRAESIVLIQVVHNIDSTLRSKELAFTNNTLTGNSAPNSSIIASNKDNNNNGELCAVVLSGTLYYKETDLRFNKFNNTKYSSEVCVRVPAISQRDVVNVSLNWWGTTHRSGVRDRIWDFDDSYDYAIANDRPFLLRDDDTMLVSLDQHDFKQHEATLSGRLFESLTLKASKSPYNVTSDLTVLENVTLTIEAGVTLKVTPGVSILVAGDLQARGTLGKPVVFTVNRPERKNGDSHLPVRLVDGNFPWEGRVEVFYCDSWKPISTSGHISTKNVTAMVCKQLGYDSAINDDANVDQMTQKVNGSWLLEVGCQGNETFLHECSLIQRAFNVSSALAFAKCQATAWGNLRFISSRGVNSTQQQSSLSHVEILYCGSRHGNNVPAIETEINVPKLSYVTARNCTSGGLRMHAPETNVHVDNSAFVNTGKTGLSIAQTQHSIVIENFESSRNERGISMEETSADNVPRVHYGRVFLCSDEKALHVQNQTLLYFKIPRLKNTMASESCQKVLTVPKGRGMKVTLLFFKGTQQLQVYDSANTRNLIVDKSTRYLPSLVHKELFIPRDTIMAKWTGDVNSEVLIQVQDLNIEEAPCTFEVGFCGWQTFNNMSINGLSVTRTWRIWQYDYWRDRGSDYSYFHTNGKRLYIGNDRWPTYDGRAAIISPPITQNSQLCSVVFFYRVSKKGRAGLSLYTQTGTFPNIKQTLIWSAKNVEVPSWKKVVMDLPTDLDEYRLLIEGEYNKTSSYRSRNYVTVDNLELRSCLKKGEHRISNSVFSSNTHQAINYTSVATGSDVRPRLTVQRCQITDTPASASNMPRKSSLSLEIQDNNFTLSNNFISGNRLGAVQARLGRSDGSNLPRSLIFGNTFSRNANGTIVVEKRRGITTNYSFVSIVENAFGSNLGFDSAIKLSEIQSEIVNNFFYNNSGLHSIEYDFSNSWPNEQKCELNTFFLNKGLGQNYGVTVLSKGPMKYHKNNFKNPSNLYELSSTRQAVSDPIDAVDNWWGVGTEPSVGLRIYEKEDDYRLVSVEYKPFLKLPPRNILSLGCPADWLNIGSTCFAVRSGSRTFKEAQNYCQYYGGHVASTIVPGDMEFINMKIEATRPDGKPSAPIWVTTEENMEEDNSGKQTSKRCTVMTQNRVEEVVPCNSLYPFVCTRNAVIRCPNGCFHNGDCVGATCFCYRGWTGRDCSQFHCNDVHNCSGNGQCVGPNVCKCTPGFLGRGCTYSYCTKFKRCSTCSQDSACGWCDSLQQCMPGTSLGPYAAECPDWFYYTCYTVGSVNHCSNKIQRVDCTNRQCNYTQDATTSESCQKCEDLQKCYNNVEEGKCRAWNDTRCPHGLVKVDYTDPDRIESTLLRSNVKVINPNTTIIYSCPVMLPGRDDTTSVFVAPRGLGIKAGDVLSSAQAGGVMHKVNLTTNTGPYTIVLGSPAQVEDVIQYADFTKRVSPVRLADKSTVDEEPDAEELFGLMDGSIKLNSSDLHVLPSDTSVFKCAGHLYKINDELVSTQFLVLNKDQAFNVRPGDVIVSAQSHGFIEKVTRVNQTSDMVFLETELERCTENSTWNHRFNPRIPGAPSDNDVICTGGDNSYGLIITEPDVNQQQISVNDSIVGRSSSPFIAKVVEAHVSGDFVLVEFLYVQAIVNGTAVTPVSSDELKREHRRHKRDVDRETIRFRKSYPMERKLSLFGKAYANVQQTFKVYADFIVSMGVFTDRDQDGDFMIADVLFGVEMVGEVIFNVDVQFGIEVSFDYLKKSFPFVKPIQLADFCIPITGVCIPSAVFFEVNVDVGAKAAGKAFFPIKFTSSARLGLGGICTRYGGCNRISPEFSINRNINSGRPTAEGEYAAECQLVPKLTLRVPTVPRFLKRLVNRFNSLWKKVFKEFLGYSPGDSSSTGDFSIIRLSVEVPIGLKAAVQPCNGDCLKKSSREPNKFTYSFGFSEVVAKLSVGFGEKNYDLAALNVNLKPGGKPPEICFSCGNKEDNCGCPTTPPPTTTQSTTAVTTTELTTATESTTPYTGSSTPHTGSTTPYTGSTTPFTGSTTPFTGSTTSPPPTTPTPCECEDGKEGFLGSDGHCNCPPECDEGKEPVFVNNRYRCPEHPPCGEHPNCVVGRKGSDCSQPDVQPCSSDCSGNGAAVATADCGSRCVCSVRWTGTCCETRRPWRNWGDPHLETLDGIEYDYYGIGEFWGCKSLFNDFGIQFRYFAYQRASLTGGVAVKAGQSALSIIAINTTNPRKFPKLRIDGTLVNITAHIGKKMKLDNGTVVMDIQKTFSSELDESGIVLMSLQFESGLTLTADVRHSNVMGRQYLNVLFTPTVAFKGHTEGLCGVMDNDPSNDMRGSDGEQYNDPIKFAESWRITVAQNNSGLRGSWSWNASNFHGDDVMDSSYTDPDFVPVYSLDGIDDAIVAKATEACSSLGLTKTMLQSCIYDVAVTNDTSLTAQETLQQDCTDQCSGKGRCVNSTCQCMIGWSGDSCQLGDCTNCSTKHGRCMKGFCECEDGWEGVTCEQKATCYNVNNCTSPNNGICRRTDECRCHDGYIGSDCSIVPTCSNVSECSRKGICIDYDVCKCQEDWTGNDCTQYSCSSLDHCSGHGRCVARYKCDCNSGWVGVSCALPDCAGANQCSGQGECVSRDTCQCYPGFQGVNCSDVAQCAHLGNCSGHGVCTQEKHGGNLTCRCYAGFSGVNCSIASCFSVNNCSGHGRCIEANLCKCDVGYTGADCANASCEAINYCSGHGVCVGHDICVCDHQWHGPACSVADCSSINDCSNKGDCILPNTCECYPGFDGAACNTTAKPNLYAPVFAAPLYNVSVSENVPMGTKILRVHASDADSGRNAQLFYSLVDDNVVSTAFTIDSLSGEIFISSALDYESSSPHLYKLKIVASDNGSPPKSSFVFVYITIVDENDNCPVFNSLQTHFFNISRYTHPGTLLTVISAVDKDSGLNGKVKYGFSYASDGDGAFKVGEGSGEVTVAKGLREMDYRLLVVARDQGVPSCSRQIVLTVNVYGGVQVTEEPTQDSTVVATEAKNSTTTMKSTDIPVSHPNSRWYKNPAIIMGISVGGFVVFVLLSLAIVLALSWKWKRRVKPVDDYPLIRGCRLGGRAGCENSGESTPDCNIVEDLEMEDVAVALHRIKATEQYEMKRMPHLDF